VDQLTLMDAFVRVVNAGSFSAAARSWGRSKAVVSKYVSALETHLGVALLRRTTRSLSLTDAGRSYLTHCVDVLEQIEAAEALLRREHASPRGRLRVTAPPGFTSIFGRAMTTEFVARYPDIQMELYLTHRMVDLVDEGFDAAIRVTTPRDSALIARRLGPAPLMAVAAPDYLERRGEPQSPAELREHDCLVDTNHRNRERWRFRVDGKVQVVEVDGPFRVNSPTLVRDLAIEGQGVAILPAFVVLDALDTGELTEVLAGMVATEWQILAIYPRRRHLARRVRVFIDHLAEALS
jgi:DNA-binding transcriptional LysR family regulator